MLHLPETNNEYWNDSEKSIVDLASIEDSICKDCIFQLNNEERVIQCVNCLRGHKFRGGDIEERNKEYYFHNKKINLINGQTKTTSGTNQEKE